VFTDRGRPEEWFLKATDRFDKTIVFCEDIEGGRSGRSGRMRMVARIAPRQETLRAMVAWGRRTALVVALLIGVGSPGIARAQSTAPPSLVPGSVLLHIESPEPVDLERETGDRRDPFYVACTSPCDEWVPATGKYRIAGAGTRASRPFELLAKAGRETVVVSPASSAAFGIGIAAIAVGGVAAAIGGLGLLSASFGDDPNGSGGSGPIDLALGVIAGGLLAEACGIVLVVSNAGSRVNQTTPFGPSAKSSSGLFPSDVAHRGAPIPGYPPAASWPLLRLAF
jgi:hypothetical protein